MKARWAAIGAAASLTVFAAACTGSGRTHTQSVPPTSGSSSSTRATPTSPSDRQTSTAGMPSAKPVSTPSVAATGQPAVNAYVGMANVLDRWALDPRLSMKAALQRYVTSSALSDFVRIYHQMASNHLAYRGNPDVPHFKVISAGGSSAFLSECSVAAAVNPSIQYNVITGKAVKTRGGGPYPKTVTVLKRSGSWRVNSIIPNTAKVCSG